MQAELNKYFYNDITNIILDYYYKTMFYNNIIEIKKVAGRRGTMLPYSDKHTVPVSETDDDSDDEDDSGVSMEDAKPHVVKFWIENFRRSMFHTFRLRYHRTYDDSDDEY